MNALVERETHSQTGKLSNSDMLCFKSILLCVVLLAAKVAISQEICAQRDYGNGGTVCVCNSSYCDTIPRIEKLPSSDYVIYTSSKTGLRFHKTVGKVSSIDTLPWDSIMINPNVKRQTINGWGGAFSDATGININSLNDAARNNLLRSYFSKDGIEYSLCRVPIGGTDFSTHGYSYNDGDVDLNLTRFSLASEDHEYKIPLIKAALNLTNNNLELFASAWTAPKWMKTNGEYAGHGKIFKPMYQTWADYFLKFLQHYKAENISFWGITTGNEPNTALLPFNKINTVAWSPAEMGTWLATNLGPTLRNSVFSSIKIIGLDDQRFFLPFYAYSMFSIEKAKNYVDGIAVHWYMDFLSPPSVLSWTHNFYPDKFLLATEACEGPNMPPYVLLGAWSRAESYAKSIIENIQNWVTGWIDWNMALNTGGGPTYINNFVDSPIIVNASAGEFYKQPMFYAIGHFSKFVPRGSVVIEAKTPISSWLKVVAFQRPDNGIAIVIFNRQNKDAFANIKIAGKNTLSTKLLAKSISTILIW